MTQAAAAEVQEEDDSESSGDDDNLVRHPLNKYLLNHGEEPTLDVKNQMDEDYKIMLSLKNKITELRTHYRSTKNKDYDAARDKQYLKDFDICSFGEEHTPLFIYLKHHGKAPKNRKLGEQLEEDFEPINKLINKVSNLYSKIKRNVTAKKSASDRKSKQPRTS